MHKVWQAVFIAILLFLSLFLSNAYDITEIIPVYFIIGIIIVFTFGRMRWHIVQPQLRKTLDSTLLTIICFLCLRVFKMTLWDSDGSIIRFCWYLYYPCFLMLGYQVLKMASILNYLSPEEKALNWSTWVDVLNFCITAIILTNDYHQLMFTFQDNFANSGNEYGNGILCWPIKIYIMLQFCIPVLFLLKEAIDYSYLRKAMLLPLGVLVYSIAYHILYSMNVPLIRNTETVIVTCFSIMTFWYTALKSGLIATNDKYVELFYASGLQDKIAARRLRQEIFLKLEEIVAEERPKLLEGINLLQKTKDNAARGGILQELRLSASNIKKQCLMFLQGEIYGYVPIEDFIGSVQEIVRYAREAGIFVSLNIEIQLEHLHTGKAMFTHQLVARVLAMVLEQGIDSLIINLQGNDRRLEINILVDQEYRQIFESFYLHSRNSFPKSFNVELLLNEDTISLRLVSEVEQ